MAALTTAEKADIRLVTGSTNLTGVITDAILQAQYDIALVEAPDSSMVFPYTYVYILLRLLGYYSVQVTRTTDHGDNERTSDYFKQVKELLALWGTFTGLTDENGVMLGSLSVGTLALGIDATEDNQSDWDGSE